jgi:heme/copper-type cytochrome/quinol oxidase subunit 1
MKITSLALVFVATLPLLGALVASATRTTRAASRIANVCSFLVLVVAAILFVATTRAIDGGAAGIDD